MADTLSVGQVRLYAGDFNRMEQSWQADGSVIIVLQTTGDATAHVMHVSGLYGPNELVLSESEIDVAASAVQQARQAEADARAGALRAARNPHGGPPGQQPTGA